MYLLIFMKYIDFCMATLTFKTIKTSLHVSASKCGKVVCFTVKQWSNFIKIMLTFPRWNQSYCQDGGEPINPMIGGLNSHGGARGLKVSILVNIENHLVL